MNEPNEPVFNRVLVIGAGAAGLHAAADLAAGGWCTRIGLLNRDGERARRLEAALHTSEMVIEVHYEPGKIAQPPKRVKLDQYHIGYEAVEDRWDTIVLAIPSDEYKAAIKALPLHRMNGLRTIMLLSPGIGSCLLVRSAAGMQRDRLQIISLSTYYAASRLHPDPARPETVIVKGVKKKVTAGAVGPGHIPLKRLQAFIESLKLECAIADHALDAEARSITTYVHPAFFIHTFSLQEIFYSGGTGLLNPCINYFRKVRLCRSRFAIWCFCGRK
ncbi:opine metallophore biosynthesis dehydrogenase [Paenibacillus protaetiae]|uniref:DUF2338 family protein n=1 Tax=Paenibacillus protaetiae TaxID=2509456 RepID=A0A4P6EUW5_9BACL|nr:opine metallophore biosynthesis dehydrogenase [Paenibacillus protaetiae]QAY65933.1 DUF2338 family protein [Paenibacillus protaetiae]